MKGVAILAVGLTIASCSHDAWNQQTDRAWQAAEEYSSNFKNIVMGGQNVDGRQTWTTAVTTQITLTSAKAGTLKIYATDPVQGTSVAALYTSAIGKGETRTFSVARPQDATTLYAVILDDNNYMTDIMAFDASEEQVQTAFYSNAAAARQQSRRRSIQPAFDFPGDADASKFLSDVPAGVNKLTQNAASLNGWIDNTWTDKINGWGAWDGSKTTGGTLYIKGNCDFSSRSFYMASNSEIYLLEGATLKLSATDAGNLQGGTNIYIAANAKLVAAGELKLNNGLYIYNHGTIEAPKVSVNNASVLYNTNMVKVTGELSTENSNSVIVNDGTMTATRLHTAGSSHVQNNATMTISGNTDIDSNNNTWVNNGQYTTSYFYYTAGSNDVINNCRLTVNNLFKINLGDTDRNGFRMDSNSGVVTKDFEAAGPCFIYMGAQSVFEVTRTATMNITKDVYGIYGPSTGGQAVFHAKKIVNGAADANQCFVANYFDNLIVAYDESHFPQGYSDGTSDAAKANGGIGSQPYYRIGDGAVVEQTQYVNYSVTSGTCNPGFNGGGGSKPEPKQYVYFAFEDLGTSDDFDFNDVVVRVGMPDDSNMSTVELCAIGGTLEQKVFCGDTQIGEEVHQYGKFGDNTQRVVGMPISTLGTVNVPAGTSVNDLDIKIQVTRRDGQVVTISAPQAGEIPFRVTVMGDEQGKWFWAKERVNISDAYNLFGEWGANMDSNTDWYKHPVNGSIVTW